MWTCCRHYSDWKFVAEMFWVLYYSRSPEIRSRSGDRRLSRLLVPYTNALFEYELTSSRQILKMKQDVTLEQKESVDIVLMSVRCEICIYWYINQVCFQLDEVFRAQNSLLFCWEPRMEAVLVTQPRGLKERKRRQSPRGWVTKTADIRG